MREMQRTIDKQKSLGSFLFVGIFCLLSTAPFFVHAATLVGVSDLISSSIPSATTTNHTITFRTPNAIPPGGKIIVTFTPNAFDIPATLDFSDVDFLVGSATSSLVQRALAATAGVGVSGVSVVSGMSGSMTITLGSDVGSGISANDYIEIRIGNHATFENTGDQWIINPANPNSYHIRLRTTDSSDIEIDSGSTLIAIISPVTVTAELNIVEPVRSNGLPTGLLPGGTASVWLSLNTDIGATCRYATTTDVPYNSMLPSTQFTSANLGTLHYREEPVTDNTIYNFYVRCQAYNLVVNSTDYLINFEVGVVPSATATPPPPPGSSGGSSFSGGGGGGGPFLRGGDVTLEGETVPLATLVILKDGKVEKEEQVSVTGTFRNMFTGLERGTYTWGTYVRDPEGRTSTTYNSTIYLIGGTNNIIAPIYVSPTIRVASSSVPIGTPAIVRGYAIPLREVLVLMNKQGEATTGKIVTATTTANGNGSWSVAIATEGLARGTYEIKARSIISAKDQSMLSPIAFLGIGEDPNPDFRNRSDLNQDGRVNLIDFSILLFHWNGSDATADINLDGRVNLTDFSIMLANWTG